MSANLEHENEERLTLDELRDVWSALSTAERIEAFLAAPARRGRGLLPRAAGRDRPSCCSRCPRRAPLVDAPAPARRRRRPRAAGGARRQREPARAARRADAQGGHRPARLRRGRGRRADEPALRAPAAARCASTRRSATCASRRASALETIYYVYVLDEQQRLLGVVSFRELFAAAPDKRGARHHAHRRRDGAARTWTRRRSAACSRSTTCIAIPVVDAEGRMKGIVTVDDIVDVVQEEATEDIQKFGGMEALDAPYLKIAFARMMRKRAAGSRRCSSARCSPRPRWRTSRTRSRARWCSRCSCR